MASEETGWLSTSKNTTCWQRTTSKEGSQFNIPFSNKKTPALYVNMYVRSIVIFSSLVILRICKGKF